jgi:hypothetical protein
MRLDLAQGPRGLRQPVVAAAMLASWNQSAVFHDLGIADVPTPREDQAR